MKEKLQSLLLCWLVLVMAKLPLRPPQKLLFAATNAWSPLLRSQEDVVMVRMGGRLWWSAKTDLGSSSSARLFWGTLHPQCLAQSFSPSRTASTAAAVRSATSSLRRMRCT